MNGLGFVLAIVASIIGGALAGYFFKFKEVSIRRTLTQKGQAKNKSIVKQAGRDITEVTIQGDTEQRPIEKPIVERLWHLKGLCAVCHEATDILELLSYKQVKVFADLSENERQIVSQMLTSIWSRADLLKRFQFFEVEFYNRLGDIVNKAKHQPSSVSIKNLLVSVKTTWEKVDATIIGLYDTKAFGEGHEPLSK